MIIVVRVGAAPPSVVNGTIIWVRLHVGVTHGYCLLPPTQR